MRQKVGWQTGRLVALSSLSTGLTDVATGTGPLATMGPGPKHNEASLRKGDDGTLDCLQQTDIRTMMHDGFPTAHRLTFLSSPPVTRTRPDLLPSERQFTFAPWAENSSATERDQRET